MDRVPIEEAVDKTEPSEETPEVPGISGDSKGLSEMQDLNEMSVMFGFETPGFDGMGKEAENIYQWAVETTGGSGERALTAVKLAIGMSGITAKGRELMVKLNRWVSLDSQMQDLRKRKELLNA